MARQAIAEQPSAAIVNIPTEEEAREKARAMSQVYVVGYPLKDDRDLTPLAKGSLVMVGDVSGWSHVLCRVVSDDGGNGDRQITIEKVLRDEQLTLLRSRVRVAS